MGRPKKYLEELKTCKFKLLISEYKDLKNYLGGEPNQEFYRNLIQYFLKNPNILNEKKFDQIKEDINLLDEEYSKKL